MRNEPKEPRWSVEPRPYVGDTGVIYVGFCHDCRYDTGKNATVRHADSRVEAHWKAKHGGSA